MNPSISIIILTYNAAPWLKDSLPHFLGQAYDGEWEILVIDSGSTDETLQLIEPHERVRVHSIPNESFGHGPTRNLAASIAHGDLLLYTVQDACPRNDQWMRKMAQALIENDLDAVCGGQAVPHDIDKNPAQWYRPLAETDEVEIIRGKQFEQWSPIQQMDACGWDNVNALYRKESLTQIPFQNVRFGEDMTWAKNNLLAHGNIGYAKNHKIWHYHHQYRGFTRKRTIFVLFWRAKTFDVLPKIAHRPNLLFLMKVTKATIHANIRNPLTIIFWIRYNWQTQREVYLAGQEFQRAYLNGKEEISKLYDSLGEKSPMASHVERQST